MAQPEGNRTKAKKAVRVFPVRLVTFCLHHLVFSAPAIRAHETR